MSVTFGANIPSGYVAALRQHVYTMQVRALPQVEWGWRFFPISGGKSVRVELRIAARGADDRGWDEDREFDTEIPADAHAARTALSAWFDGIHAQFRKASKKGVDDVDVLG
jgi:hypothetical protein